MKKMTVHEFLNKHEGYASRELRENVRDLNLPENSIIYNPAYTDYGGDVSDKLVIKYIRENYPNNILWETTCYFGENAIIFFNPNLPEDEQLDFEEFSETAEESCILYFEGLEDLWSEFEFEKTWEALSDFYDYAKEYKLCIIKDRKKIFLQKAYDAIAGFFTVLVTGLDYCENSMIEILAEHGVVDRYKNSPRKK